MIIQQVVDEVLNTRDWRETHIIIREIENPVVLYCLQQLEKRPGVKMYIEKQIEKCFDVWREYIYKIKDKEDKKLS